MMTELNNLLQAIASPAYFFDKEDHRIVAVNSHFSRLLEYSEAELLTMKLEDFRPPEDIPKVQKAIRQNPSQGSVEWRYLTSSGALLYVQLSYRDSVFYDRKQGSPRDVRLVVISK